MKSRIILVVALIFGGGLALASRPFLPKTIVEEVSSDGQDRIRITRRILFPPSEFLDPEAQVTIELSSLKDPALGVHVISFVAEEESDVQPKLTWSQESLKLLLMPNGTYEFQRPFSGNKVQ